MSNDYDDLTDQKCINHHLYVEGRGQSLIAAGKIGGQPSITARGISEYDQLLASGFQPVRHIVRAILRRYHGVRGEELEYLTDLIMG